MTRRPILERGLDSGEFRDYYYLKEELVAFCRAEGLPTAGSKEELSGRIACFLDTGEVPPPRKAAPRKAPAAAQISLDSVIERDFVCSERHRAFFKAQLGAGFTFPVAFQKWLKSNPGKTYREAIEAYRRILAEKKVGETTIDKQFEYNTYIRAFFAENRGKSLNEAIRCWKYKKRLPGHNRYEAGDLAALDGAEGSST